MKILAIDTSGKVASVALVEDGKFIDTIEKNTNLSHSQAVLPVCMELLEKNEITLKDIDCFATVVGPGSFTGLRIGIAAAKGFAISMTERAVNNELIESDLYFMIFAKCIIISIIPAKRVAVTSPLIPFAATIPATMVANAAVGPAIWIRLPPKSETMNPAAIAV